jgi:hypothetical protein
MQRNPKNTKADHLEIIRFIALWVVRRLEPFDASDTSVYIGTNPNKGILYTNRKAIDPSRGSIVQFHGRKKGGGRKSNLHQSHCKSRENKGCVNFKLNK